MKIEVCAECQKKPVRQDQHIKLYWCCHTRCLISKHQKTGNLTGWAAAGPGSIEDFLKIFDFSKKIVDQAEGTGALKRP